MDYKQEIAKCLAACLSSCLTEEEACCLLVPPKDIAMGDICLPCFRLAKTMRMSPVAIADKLAAELELPPFVAEVKSVAGYLNFKFSSHDFASTVLGKVLEEGVSYGKSNEGPYSHYRQW